MKHFGNLILCGIVGLLASCSEETQGLAPEESCTLPIQVSSSATDFQTRVEDIGIDELKMNGFKVWSFKEHQSGSSELNEYFAADCRYNVNQWILMPEQVWPDKTTKLDFYALFPGTDDDRFFLDEEGRNLYVELGDLYFDGTHDMLFAKKESASFEETSGNVAFEFNHLLTKVTLKVAFSDSLVFSYPSYWAELRTLSDKTSTYNVTSGEWKVDEYMPVDFSYENFWENLSFQSSSFGERDSLISATPADSPAVYYTACTGYMLPLLHRSFCSLYGNIDSLSCMQAAKGFFDLDLTDKAGCSIVVKVKCVAQGAGNIPNMTVEVTEDNLEVVD